MAERTMIQVITPPEDQVWYWGYYSAGIWSAVVSLLSMGLIGFFGPGFNDLANTVIGSALGGAAYVGYELIVRVGEEQETRSRRYYFLIYFLGPIFAMMVGFAIYFIFFAGGEFNTGGLTITADTKGSYVAKGLSRASSGRLC